MRNMEILSAIMLILLSGLFSCSSAATKQFIPGRQHLIGKWEGFDHTGKQGAFQFFEDGNVILIIDGSPLGGVEATGLGRLTYTADFSKNPSELDIIGLDPVGNEHGAILMIVKFITPDRIKIRTFFNETRPANFDDETTDDTIVLDRQAE
jgi:hypothetical protein